MTRITLFLACLMAASAVPAQADDRTDRQILAALQAIRQELRALRSEVGQLKRGNHTAPRASSSRVLRAMPTPPSDRGADAQRRKALEQYRRAYRTYRGHSTPTPQPSRSSRAKKHMEHEAIIILEGEDGVQRRYHLPRDYHKIPAELRKHIPSLGGGARPRVLVERVMKKSKKHGDYSQAIIEVKKLAEAARKQAEGAKRNAQRLHSTARLHRAHSARRSGEPKIHVRVHGNHVIVEVEVNGKKTRKVVPLPGARSSSPRYHAQPKQGGMYFSVPKGAKKGGMQFQWKNAPQGGRLQPVPGKKGMYFAVPAQPKAKKAPRVMKRMELRRAPATPQRPDMKKAYKQLKSMKGQVPDEVIELLKKLQKELEKAERSARRGPQYF